MKLEFNDDEMDYLFKVLSQRPWGEVHPLMIRIQIQIQEQQNAGNQSNGPTGTDSAGGPGGPGSSGNPSPVGIQP